jgi:hypothetical protein
LKRKILEPDLFVKDLYTTSTLVIFTGDYLQIKKKNDLNDGIYQYRKY